MVEQRRRLRPRANEGSEPAPDPFSGGKSSARSQPLAMGCYPTILVRMEGLGIWI